MLFGPQDRAILLSAILVALLTLISTPLSTHALWNTRAQKNVKVSVILSQKFEIGPGNVINRYIPNVEFPRGHIAVKGVTAELVDEQGNSIPLEDTYLHHWLFDRYYQRIGTTIDYNGTYLPDTSNTIFLRNSGLCQSDVYAQTFGSGSETRKTDTDIPDPFGIEIGNPALVPEGFEERWMMNVHAIDLRGVESTIGCTECWCHLYNVTQDVYGRPLRPDYYGGYLCCYDHTQCKIRDGFDAPRKSFYVKYTVKWVDWDTSIVPLRVYIIDVTDSVQVLKLPGQMTAIQHNCQTMYEVKECNHESGEECVNVKRTSVPMEKGGYVVWAAGHQHVGGLGIAIYRQDGSNICMSIMEYGNGTEAGNEAGYIVGTNACYPTPGSMMINDGEFITIESNYSTTQMHVGLMGVFYFYVADQMPPYYFSRASLLSSF